MGKRKQNIPSYIQDQIWSLKKRIADLEAVVYKKPPEPELPLREEVAVKDTPNKINIWFDGGMKYGVEGYGSWQIEQNGVLYDIARCSFPNALSSNQAELMTLRDALYAAVRSDFSRESIHLVVHGDSQLALFTSSGKWNAKHPNVKPIALENREIMKSFGKLTVQWIPRDHMVERFGH